jgi:hypothetical protein
VIVADTSAWIEFFRGSAHPSRPRLKQLLESSADLAVTEVVLMEVLAGRRSGEHAEQARERLLALPMLRLEGAADFEEAARIYRACRDAGQTIRSQLDLLIAVPVIRHGASLLHNDRDFEVIARHSGLKLEPLASTARPGSHDLRERVGAYRRGTSQASSRASRDPRGARLPSKA